MSLPGCHPSLIVVLTVHKPAKHLGLFSESQDSLQLLFSDTAKDFNTRPRTELGIGLLVTCLLVVLILLLAIGFYFHRRKLGKIVPEGRMCRCIFFLPETKVIYPRWSREILYHPYNNADPTILPHPGLITPKTIKIQAYLSLLLGTSHGA